MEELKRWRAAERDAFALIVEGARNGDISWFVRSLEAVRYRPTIARRAFRAVIAQALTMSAQFKCDCRDHWVCNGGIIRDQSSGDLFLIDLPRAILPPYHGPARKLWRGEGWLNRPERSPGT
jgi:hypothetical protein